MATVVYVGDSANLTKTFTDSGGDAADPTTVSLTVTTPVGVATTYTYAGGQITKSGTGVYTKAITSTEAGTWRYVWSGAGAVVDTDPGEWETFALPAASHRYASVDDLREHFGDTSEVLPADVCERALDASSRWIDEYCGRRFYLDVAASARTYRPDDSELVWVDDIGSTTDLVVETDDNGDGTWVTTWVKDTDYQLEPLRASARSAYAWWRLAAIGTKTFPVNVGRRPALRVTARWGWSAVPPGVAEACLLVAAALVHRKNSPNGVAGWGEMGVVRIGRTDPDVIRLLQPYVRLDMVGVSGPVTTWTRSILDTAS